MFFFHLKIFKEKSNDENRKVNEIFFLHIKNLNPREERKKWRKVELTTSIILKG